MAHYIMIDEESPSNLTLEDSEKYRMLEYLWELCDRYNVSVPPEVKQYFNGKKPLTGQNTGVIFPQDEYEITSEHFSDDEQQEWASEYDRIKMGIQGEMTE